MTTRDPAPKFWNVWWTLTVISAIVTIVGAILAMLGI